MEFTGFYNKRIFCDLDGVLCDYEAQWNLMTKTGMSPSKFVDMYGKDELIEELKKHGEKFWSTMPFKPDGLLLWNYIKRHRPIILTSHIKTDECSRGKTIWVRNHLSPIITEVIISSEKEKYADKYSLLIDDKGKNVRKFIIAGGSGIIHESSIETIKELKEKYGI